MKDTNYVRAQIRKDFGKAMQISEETKKLLEENKHSGKTHCARLNYDFNGELVSLDNHSILKPVLVTMRYPING